MKSILTPSKLDYLDQEVVFGEIAKVIAVLDLKLIKLMLLTL